MTRFVLPFAVALLLPAGVLGAQTVREIRLEHDAVAGEYRFAPTKLEAHAGDVLVFKVTGGGDHSIVFEDGMSAAARSALGAAMPRRVGELAGPILGPRAEYRIVLPRLPAGEYRFYCLAHRAYDEAGVLSIR